MAKAVLKSAPATNVAVKRRVYGTKKELRIAVSLAAQGLQRFYAFILSYAPVLQQKSRIRIRLFVVCRLLALEAVVVVWQFALTFAAIRQADFQETIANHEGEVAGVVVQLKVFLVGSVAV